VRALVLAAGEGRRLRPYTEDRPKCLVELAGVPLLERQLSVLRAAGIDSITVVGGYRAEQLGGRGFELVENPEYRSTNMVATLFCARERLRGDEDVVVSYGDIVYEPRVLSALLRCGAPVAVVVDRSWRPYWERRMADPLSDAETLKLDNEGRILELGKKPGGFADIQGQYLGLFKIRSDRVTPMVESYDAMDRTARYDDQGFPGMYMTSFLQHLIDAGWDVRAVPVDNGWLETDTVEDLELYHSMLKEGTLGRLCELE
jgi:choline kinase